MSPDIPLQMTASCSSGPACIFVGEDMLIAVHIRNRSESEIGFPLEFVQSTGPSVQLIDARTDADTWLKTNLANHDLKETFTRIPPGGEVVVNWVIMADEITQFGHLTVDVVARIGILAGIEMDGQRVEFDAETDLHIMSPDARARAGR